MFNSVGFCCSARTMPGRRSNNSRWLLSMIVGTSLSCTTLVFFVTVIVGPSTSGNEWAYRVLRLKSQRLPRTYTVSSGSFCWASLVFAGTGAEFAVEAESPAATELVPWAIADEQEPSNRSSAASDRQIDSALGMNGPRTEKALTLNANQDLLPAIVVSSRLFRALRISPVSRAPIIDPRPLHLLLE